MASYQQLFYQARSPFESPAKIFAKLKSQVQREVADDVFDDERRAAEFHEVLRSPKRRTTENGPMHEMFGNGEEVTALTLSPIPSPQKSIGSRPEREQLPCTIAYMPRQRPVMESTTVSNTTTEPHMDVLYTRDKCADGYVHCDPGVLEEAPQSVFSPVRKRLRKRKLDEQLLSKANYMVPNMDYIHCQEKERKLSRACIENDHYMSKREVDPVALKQSGHTQSDIKGMTPLTLPRYPVTPAKIFAFLKEKENNRDLSNVQKVQSSTKPEADWSKPWDPTCNRYSCNNLPIVDDQREVREEPNCAMSIMDTLQSPDLDQEVPLPHDPMSTVPLQAVVLEDPLVLKSPRVSIPKLPQVVLKRYRWPQCTSFPNENVIHLKNWFIRKSRNGLFIDGIHREKNIPWNSNLISERVSKNVLKTVTGRVYVLDGKMDLNAPSQFPKWFLKRFVNGFPTKWREIYEKYLSELKSVKRGSKTQSDKRSQKSTAYKDQSPQPQNEKVETPKLCPSSNTPNIQVSRSGRLIKPPLDYWKGGRVILDAHMNVTIHDGYDSIIQPEVRASIITKPLFPTMPVKKPPLEKVPVNDECESIQQSQLKRRVKAQQRKPHKAIENIIKTPTSPIKQSLPTRVTRSDSACQDTETTSDKAERKTFKEQRGTKVVRSKVCKRLDSSLCSPPVASCGSQPLTHRREKENEKTGAKCTDEKSMKSLPGRSSRSSRSSQEKETPAQKSRKHSNVGRKPRSKKSSPKPSQITKQTASRPNKARKKTARHTHSSVLDGDAWTEEELRKLQEAVSCHPKYVPGYWTKVAMMVGTRSAEECHRQHSSQGGSKTPTKRVKKAKQKALVKEIVDNPVISARMGTLRRKQQVRDFLDAIPKEDMDDVFSSEYMRSRRFEMPSMCPSDENDFSVSDKEPVTPKHSGFLEAKTPQCQHITPGMMGSSSRNYDDKYVYQLQKRMKNHYQFNVQKHAPKNFSPTASVKRTMKRCGNTENDTFVVWEMFPDQEAQTDSGEEEDFYFSEND